MTLKERVYQKYNGLCAYSGTPLESDWQIEHIIPVRRTNGVMITDNDVEENMIPVQRLINHYKHSMSLELFRDWYMANLHKRLGKLPKNPHTDKGIKRGEYLLKVAGYFGITENTHFTGKFYFETLK